MAVFKNCIIVRRIMRLNCKINLVLFYIWFSLQQRIRKVVYSNDESSFIFSSHNLNFGINFITLHS